MSNCAYCNLPKCNCGYRHSKLGKRVVNAQGTRIESTAGEMLRAVVDKFAELPLDMKGAWFVSFTEYDERKVERNVRRHDALRLSNQISK